MQAIGANALGVKIHCVCLNDETAFLGDAFLPPFNFFIVKLFDMTAVCAYQMVMVLDSLAFEYGFS